MATLNTGEFEKVIITDAGRAMISRARDDNNITFTRIALGDGQIESPDDIFTLTEIKNECLSVPIVSKTDVADGQMRLEFRLNNSEIETSFTFREIGIMAHMADGIEQLYAYTYAKDPTQIYDKNTPIQERIIYADIVVGNTENINIILNLSNTYARIQDIVDHNTDPTAHKTGIAGNAATATKAQQDINGNNIIDTYAPLKSPSFKGQPTAPTQNIEDNSTKIATTEFVRNSINTYVPIIDIIKKIYPVGSIYTATISTNPATLFGFGTWEAMPAGRVLLAQGESDLGIYNAGSTGGEATHKLNINELPYVQPQASSSVEYLTGGFGSARTRTPTPWAVGMCSLTLNERTLSANTGNIDNVIDVNINATHAHTITINGFGGGQAHNNMQPYIAVYMWKRTA